MQMTNALAYDNDDIYIYTLETSVTQDRNNRHGRLPNRRRQSPAFKVKPRNHSPDGATKTRNGLLCCYSFIHPKRMKGWVGLVGWPIADGLPTFSPVGYRPRIGQGQFAGQRPAFCQLCYATNHTESVLLFLLTLLFSNSNLIDDACSTRLNQV